MKHEENQVGWFVIVLMLPVLLFLSLSYFYQWGTSPVSLTGYILLSIIFLACLLLFFRMKTVLSDDHINISYGIGLIKKRILLERVEAVSVVRNRWYYGLGIKIIKNGTLYNIHGLNAVELDIKKQKTIIRIGSGDPQKLKFEIDKRIK